MYLCMYLCIFTYICTHRWQLHEHRERHVSAWWHGLIYVMHKFVNVHTHVHLTSVYMCVYTYMHMFTCTWLGCRRPQTIKYIHRHSELPLSQGRQAGRQRCILQVDGQTGRRPVNQHIAVCCAYVCTMQLNTYIPSGQLSLCGVFGWFNGQIRPVRQICRHRKKHGLRRIISTRAIDTLRDVRMCVCIHTTVYMLPTCYFVIFLRFLRAAALECVFFGCFISFFSHLIFLSVTKRSVRYEKYILYNTCVSIVYTVLHGYPT